jgi:hypothetical protein
MISSMARAEDSTSSPSLALPVGSLAVPPTSADFGTCCSESAEAALGFLGLSGAVLLVLGPSVVVLAALGPHHLLFAPQFQSANQKQMLTAFSTQGLPSLLWSAPAAVAQ